MLQSWCFTAALARASSSLLSALVETFADLPRRRVRAASTCRASLTVDV